MRSAREIAGYITQLKSQWMMNASSIASCCQATLISLAQEVGGGACGLSSSLLMCSVHSPIAEDVCEQMAWTHGQMTPYACSRTHRGVAIEEAGP